MLQVLRRPRLHHHADPGVPCRRGLRHARRRRPPEERSAPRVQVARRPGRDPRDRRPGASLANESASAQVQDPGEAPTPEAHNLVKIGFRSDVEPFSYLANPDESARGAESGSQSYQGFLADLCHYLFRDSGYTVEEVKVPTAADRFRMLKDNDIDLLCDPVTLRYTEERRSAGVFSPIVFASGVSYLRTRNRGRGSVYIGYVESTTARRS